MIKEAIILAGGKGTRLQSVVSDVPKPMASVSGKPFLTYLLDDLSNQGITNVVLAVGYKREVIMDYFGDSYKGMNLKYSIEEEALGTGGGIRLACQQIEGKEVLAINGDTFFKVVLEELWAFHQANNSDLTIALKEMKDFDRYGTVKTDDFGRILGFEEKTYKEAGLINGGVYLFKRSLLESPNLEARFSFEKDILEKKYQESGYYGLAFDTYFIDIGIPKDYEQSQHDFAAI